MTAISRATVSWNPEGLLGHSPALQHARHQLQDVAPTDLTVLLLGETGTGKGVAARALHQWSSRPHQPFVHLDCSSLPPSLIDSELFGHEKGAFTGASLQRKGRIEQAQGGTLFLDEIGELPLDAQARLLRLLQDRLIERVGGSQPLHLDVRVIAATHRDLARAVKDGTFRPDLYYRLHVFPVQLPALRERQEDIPLLAEHFLRQMARQLQQPSCSLSPAGLQALQAHPWPGNVRELEHLLQRAVVLARGGEILPEHLGLEVPEAASPALADPPPRGPALPTPLRHRRHLLGRLCPDPDPPGSVPDPGRSQVVPGPPLLGFALPLPLGLPLRSHPFPPGQRGPGPGHGTGPSAPARAGDRGLPGGVALLGRLGWVLVVFMLLGVLVIEVLLPRVGQWAEVLGSGLTNLLCMVGVTGVYWEARGRGEKIREEEEEEDGGGIGLDGD